MAMLIVDGVAVKEPSKFDYGLQDVSSSDAGRTQDSIMHKNRVAQKVKIGLAWNMTTPDETATLMQAFNPEYIDVTYHDALLNATVTKTFYTGDKSAAVHMWTANRKYYTSVSFNIIER